MDISDLFSPGDVDEHGNVSMVSENLRRAREASARYGLPRAQVHPGTTAYEHLAAHGHYLGAGCCRPSVAGHAAAIEPATVPHGT